MDDQGRIDWLEAQLQENRYTGKVVYRESTTGRGWRLHETSGNDASNSVREAIDKAMGEKEKANG